MTQIDSKCRIGSWKWMVLLVVCWILLVFGYGLACGQDKNIIYGAPTRGDITMIFGDTTIMGDCYTLHNNPITKFADWVAYRLDSASVTGDAELKRKWKTDPRLPDGKTLSPSDYKGANAALNVDRGHQAPLASFKGRDCWGTTNFLSNITPQKAPLNQGPWKNLEGKVRQLAKKYTVYVITGPLYEREMELLPNAALPHKVPSGYWKIIVVLELKRTSRTTPLDLDLEILSIDIEASPIIVAFIMDQNTERRAKVIDHLVTVDDVENATCFNFLWELPDDIEDLLEADRGEQWAKEHFE